MIIRLVVAATLAFPFLSQLPLLFLYFANDGKSSQNIVWWAHYTSAIGALFIIVPIFMALAIVIGFAKSITWLIFIATGLDYFSWLSVE